MNQADGPCRASRAPGDPFAARGPSHNSEITLLQNLWPGHDKHLSLDQTFSGDAASLEKSPHYDFRFALHS